MSLNDEEKLEFLKSNEIREAKIYYALPSNEYIVKFIDCFFDQSNYFYLVLEYCEGGSLDRKIKEAYNINFSISLIIKWSREILLGIDYCPQNP
jgi:NIMA (never in mitosis gene a)-related kinase